MLTSSIGIMVYNEEDNIAPLLKALLNQDLKCCKIEEIVVVASGCTDHTIEIVEEFIRNNPKVKLLIQPKREGKASAINMYLKRTTSDIIILESADTLPQKDTIDKLISAFADPAVGMVGGHPLPINGRDTFLGFTVYLQWHLHHQIALKQPKCGELVAFRNMVGEIPVRSAVDEAYIESYISQQGYQIKYVPEAIAWNKGPEVLADFISQRRRIAAGHLELKKKQKYSVSTGNAIFILFLLIIDILKQLVWIFGAVFLEAYGRFLGYKDYVFNRRQHYIWEIAKSTKQNIALEHDKATIKNSFISMF